MVEHARPRRLSLPLCSPAMVVTWRACRTLGHLLLVPGWRLGLLTEGKTESTDREEAWISYRREGWESKQGTSLDIIQGDLLSEWNVSMILRQHALEFREQDSRVVRLVRRPLHRSQVLGRVKGPLRSSP